MYLLYFTTLFFILEALTNSTIPPTNMIMPITSTLIIPTSPAEPRTSIPPMMMLNQPITKKMPLFPFIIADLLGFLITKNKTTIKIIINHKTIPPSFYSSFPSLKSPSFRLVIFTILYIFGNFHIVIVHTTRYTNDNRNTDEE